MDVGSASMGETSKPLSQFYFVTAMGTTCNVNVLQLDHISTFTALNPHFCYNR